MRRNRADAALALMASGQIIVRKADGWEILSQPVAAATLGQTA